MSIKKTSFMYMLVRENVKVDVAHVSQFHFIDSDEFGLLRSLMTLQYLPASLWGLIPSTKPFSQALDRLRTLPQFRKVATDTIHPRYWDDLITTPGVVILTPHSIPDWVIQLAKLRPLALLTSSERTLKRAQDIGNVSAGLMKGFSDIREFYRVAGEMLQRLTAYPELWSHVPKEIERLDLGQLLAIRPKLNFMDYLPSPQPWSGRSSMILLNRLSNAVEEPSLLPEEMDEPSVPPALLNWATISCGLLASREHGLGIPRGSGVKPSDVNKAAKLLQSDAASEVKLRQFLELGRLASSGKRLRHVFITIPVPRVDMVKSPPKSMTPDFGKPFHRSLALSAVTDFIAGHQRRDFVSEEAESVYDASKHTILQEQRLLACQTTWLSAVNGSVPIQLRTTRSQVPQSLVAFQHALVSSSKKTTDLFQKLEMELADSLPLDFVTSILKPAETVTLFSDYPYEWTHCEELPLCLTHPTSRIPLGLSTWYNISAALLHNYQLTPKRPDKVLILDLIEKSDPVRSYSDAFLRSSKNIGNKFTHGVPLNAAQARQLLEQTEPEIVVVDGHGRYESDTDQVSLKIQDRWYPFSEILPDFRLAPVWIVSACDTAQSEALRGCVVRALLSQGAYAVIATLARVDALIASMLIGRLLADIYQPLPNLRERTLSEIFFGTQLTTALTYDPLLPLLHKAEADPVLRERVAQMRLAFVRWTHGKPIDPVNYHHVIAQKLSEFLVEFDLYDLHQNLETAGHVRPETLLFSIFGYPDKVVVAA